MKYTVDVTNETLTIIYDKAKHEDNKYNTMIKVLKETYTQKGYKINVIDRFFDDNLGRAIESVGMDTLDLTSSMPSSIPGTVRSKSSTVNTTDAAMEHYMSEHSISMQTIDSMTNEELIEKADELLKTLNNKSFNF